ncbi:MAG: peptidylprolyl isomerase [Chthonomonas sp.]|nr:peptidylprolyl isomerase [Chthonomonas sp.]
MTTALLIGATLISPYQAKGPQVEFRLFGGSSFVITTDPKLSPKTVEHVLALVRRGFYDEQRFHRVESWVTQWGAPASRTEPLDSDAVGDGGSGKDIPIFEAAPNVDFKRGIVGVASTGFQVPGDSQLFILKRDTERLYGSYAVVGQVTRGMDVVGKIRKGDRIKWAKILK